MRPQERASRAATHETQENSTGKKEVQAFERDHEKNSFNGNSIRFPFLEPEAPEEAEGSGRQTGRSAPQPTADGRDGFRDREYLELCRDESGEVLDLDFYAKKKEERQQLLDQSNRIADLLEAEGIKARGPSNLSLVGLCSGEVIQLPDFRNIVFIPMVAARKRTPMLRHLEYFMSKYRFCRMWVFTSGTRTRLRDVRPTLQKLHRRLSKLNAEPFMKESGIQLVFRSSELGSIQKDEDGTPTFHIHAHAIVHLKAPLPRAEWSALLKKLHAFWRFHVDDSARIHKAREACKYLVKPNDLLTLSGQDLKALLDQTFRMHLVQPLGDLKEQIKLIDESGKRLVRKKGEDGPTWHLVENWNSHERKVKEEEPKEHDQPLRNWITATIQPAPILGPIAEPCAIVMNHDGKNLFHKERIRKAREAAWLAYQKGQENLSNSTETNHGKEKNVSPSPETQ